MNIHNSIKNNEKRIQTWAGKTDKQHAEADRKRRKTCLEKYGVEYNLQRKEIIDFNTLRGRPLGSTSTYEYRTELTDEIRKIRSDNMRKLNTENKIFQENRKKSLEDFLKSDRSIEYRNKKSEQAKEQHRNGQAEFVRKFYKEIYPTSDLPKKKSDYLRENNPNNIPGVQEKKKDTYIKNREQGAYESKFKKKRYKDTNLIYQSSYELDFLDFCESKHILHRIENAPILTDKSYPYNYYEPDYLLDKQYIVEIKSWWIEQLQEEKMPGLLELKRNLVESKGYKFLYLKDKDYTLLNNIIN